MRDQYIINYNVSDVKKHTEGLSEFEMNREKLILSFINTYIRRNISDTDIITYVCRQTGYTRTIIKNILDKYISLGFIETIHC